MSRQKLLEFDLPGKIIIFAWMYVFSFVFIPRQPSARNIWLLIGMHVNFVQLQLHVLGTNQLCRVKQVRYLSGEWQREPQARTTPN
jgi:hypothetical protein